jgi:hypothetical protein
MGRWGDGIYESDSALDYFSTISDRFEREMAYFFCADQIAPDGSVLERIMAVIEAILMLEQADMGSSVYLEDAEAVRHWRKLFLDVWDGDWTASRTYPNPCDDPAYRKKHRPAIAAIFDRLESIARYWESVDKNNERPALTPLHPDYPLPYFSIERWNSKDGSEHIRVERFTSDLLEALLKDIIYWLSPEKRNEVSAFHDEEVWVAVDMLGFLCEKYEQSPGVNDQSVRNWRQTSIDITKAFLDEEWDETDALYQNVMKAFDRLEAVAKKYPPVEW